MVSVVHKAVRCKADLRRRSHSTSIKSNAADGVQAGAVNNFVKTGDNRIYAFTPIIGGGESTSVTFDTKALKAGGDYTYYCSFLGHSFLMKGKFVVKA